MSDRFLRFVVIAFSEVDRDKRRANPDGHGDREEDHDDRIGNRYGGDAVGSESFRNEDPGDEIIRRRDDGARSRVSRTA